jgi:hypothetical protein
MARCGVGAAAGHPAVDLHRDPGRRGRAIEGELAREGHLAPGREGVTASGPAQRDATRLIALQDQDRLGGERNAASDRADGGRPAYDLGVRRVLVARAVALRCQMPDGDVLMLTFSELVLIVGSEISDESSAPGLASVEPRR